MTVPLVPMTTDKEELPTVRTFDRDGNEHNDVLRTKTGKVITEADIDEWVVEAEEGYETHAFIGKRPNVPCEECGRPKGKHINGPMRRREGTPGA